MRFQTQLAAPDARLYYPLSQFLPISSVFGTALLCLTTVWISYGSFNAPLHRSWSSFWRIRHSWRRRTLGLDQIIAIGSVFDGATLGHTTANTRY